MNYWIQELFGDSSQSLFDFFSTFGGPLGWLLASSLVFWLSGSRNGLRVGFVLVASGVANTYLKWLIAAPRPYYLSSDLGLRASDGFGMPSGHSQGVAALWGTIAYHFRKRWILGAAITFILFTGLARIYYGVHTSAQVGIGWFVGFAIAIAALRCESHLSRWCEATTTARLLLIIFGAGVLIGVLGVAISLGLRGDFETPVLWLENWQIAAERIASIESEPVEAFVLIDPTFVGVLVSYFWGYCLCAIVCFRQGFIEVTSHRSRLFNVTVGLPFLVVAVVLSYLPTTPSGEFVGQILFNLFTPAIVGFVIPRFGEKFR